MKVLGSILFFLLVPFTLCADDEAPGYAYVASADGGNYYFKMLPDEKSPYDWGKGSGTLYRVNPKGNDETVWKTSGWYAFQVFISYDGKYLVRLGNWPRGNKPSSEHLAIAFYQDGKLIKSYSTKDLIKDLSKVQPSVSHYRYLDSISGFKPYTYHFSIVTVDKTAYAFDVQTGKILSQ